MQMTMPEALEHAKEVQAERRQVHEIGMAVLMENRSVEDNHHVVHEDSIVTAGRRLLHLAHGLSVECRGMARHSVSGADAEAVPSNPMVRHITGETLDLEDYEEWCKQEIVDEYEKTNALRQAGQQFVAREAEFIANATAAEINARVAQLEKMKNSEGKDTPAGAEAKADKQHLEQQQKQL